MYQIYLTDIETQHYLHTSGTLNRAAHGNFVGKHPLAPAV